MEYLTSTSSVHHIDNWVEERFGPWHDDADGPQRYFSPTVQGTFFSLPGTGQPGSDCRDPVFWHCKCCGELFDIPHDCGERQCPHCSYLWVRDLAARMKGRLWDGRDHYKHQDEKAYRLHHIIVSYRMGLPADGQSYRDLRRHAYTLVQEAGLCGGCVVFHPWRENRDSNEYDVIGPHFHIFGLGHRIKPDWEMEPYTDDIIFKRVRDFDATQIDPFEYVLSHCGIPEGGHAIVWFGILAYNKMEKGPQEKVASRKPEMRSEICPTCGSDDTYYVDTHVRPGVPWDREEASL